METQSTVRFDGNEGILLSKKGPWLTVEMGDGETRKVRNSADIEILTADDIEMETEYGNQTEFTMDDFADEVIEDNNEDDLPIGGRMSNQLKHYRPRYTTHAKIEGTTESGRCVVDNADKVADELRGLWLEALYTRVAQILCKEQDCDAVEMEIELRNRYAHLNNGQQSMNLRNRVRGMYRRLAKKAETEAEAEA